MTFNTTPSLPPINIIQEDTKKEKSIISDISNICDNLLDIGEAITKPIVVKREREDYIISFKNDVADGDGDPKNEK